MRSGNVYEELQRMTESKSKAEAELNQVSSELAECKREASKSKAEVERVFTEIEKYA